MDISSHGGQVEEIITLYYDNDSMTRDGMNLERMYDKIINLRHTHAKETLEQYNILAGQRKRPIITGTNKTNNANIKREESCDPFQ